MTICPKKENEFACAAAAAEYLSSQIDLRTVVSGYAKILSEFYSPVLAEEIAGAVEPMLRFLDELNAGDIAAPMLTGFCFHRVTYEQPNKARKMKGLFGAADEPVKAREHSSDAAIKSFKAYVYAIRNEVAEMAPAGWKPSDVEESVVINKLSNQQHNPLDFI